MRSKSRPSGEQHFSAGHNLNSEHVPHAQLNLPRRPVAISIRRENLAETQPAKDVPWNIEVRMIEEVEKIPAKLQTVVLRTERHALG
jgi:hypothetical protein